MGRLGDGLRGKTRRTCKGNMQYFRSNVSICRVFFAAMLAVTIWAESLGDGFIDHMPVPFVVVELGQIYLRCEKL